MAQVLSPEQKRKNAAIIDARQKAIVAAAKENGNVFSEDQRIEYDALQAAYETLEAPVPEPRKTSPNWNIAESDASAPRSGSKPADSRLMQNLCPWVKADNGGFDRLTDFTKAVTTGDSQRLMISGQSTINDPEGGFLVPTSHSWGVLNASLETEVVRPLARNVGMPTPEHTIADWDDYSHANGQIDGGLTGQWLVEGGEMDYKVAKTQQLKLVARKLGILTSATNEMVSDAPGFEGQFEGRMRKAVGWNLDRAFLITGNGVGMPTSVMNAASTITVSKETGQAAATILWANLTKMFSRLHPDCMNRAVWICSQTLIPQLLELHIPVGTGGTVVPVLTGSAGNYQILTRPVIFTEKCNALGTKGDIILADLSQYVVGMLPQAMRFDRSMHVKFLTDETVYRLLMRVEGQPTWRSAFTPVTSGGSTLSWAVVLETRA